MKSRWKLGAVLALACGFANAGVILAPNQVINNTLGEYGSSYQTVNMLNQSGLSTGYSNGATDFDTYTSSGVTHSGGDSNSWLSSPGTYSGSFVFDLGNIFSINKFVMWNGTSGITASPASFTLETSLTSDFTSSMLVGAFSGHMANYNATIYDITDSVSRYVRMTIPGNFGNSCCIGIGDVAFDVAPASTSVPEPGSLALLGVGLVGAAFVRRKKKTS
ncbi:PEP-CTERM sorting domain-containing protein [Noviherbaspirillum sp.]|uniref:PEP-CTERM sorting domain-containing protein n=1 Tax=Noviherbaspirillum sp. TaxID=1926288 RepID=UPI002FE22BD2